MLKCSNSLFDDIAPGYDLANLVLSGGFVVYWDHKFRRALAQSGAGEAPGEPLILDLGCGTLRLARGLARAAPNSRLLGLDLSRAMLKRGLARLSPAARSGVRVAQAAPIRRVAIGHAPGAHP